MSSDQQARDKQALDIAGALGAIPPLPQSQLALDSQLLFMKAAADHLGLYDAADWLADELKRREDS